MNDPKKILIIDDEAAVRNLLRDALAAEGFSVAEAKNGAEGLTQALRDRPDLMMLDIGMPELDGIAVLKKLRNDPHGKDIPVIILSNFDDTAHVADAIESGSYSYVVKGDWDMPAMIQLVKSKLS